ncbi:MAG: DUF1553 domain-containing protein, partial [Planctomycetaceae bacterium]|nr:DUF1553 domain-containing protein [Planctomycetaceae bacterium]
ADSEGYNEEDRVRPHAWRYRDYVISSFNADKPFDQFVTEQLAGDELVPRPYQNLTAEQIDTLAATGFLRMAPDGTASGGIDQAVARNQVMADTLQIVSTSLLGMTVHCAQCHDHKYDPIPQADYYRMRSIFEPALDWSHWKVPAARQLSLYTDADRELAKQIEAEAAKVDAARQVKIEEYITRTLEEELLLVPEEAREALRAAYRTAAKDRNPEQQTLLKKYPSVASISAGSLYLYDRRRSARASKLDQERKAKEPQFVAETRRKALEQVPANQRAAVEQAAAAATEQRTDEQRALLAQFPAVLVTAATLEQFNPEAAAELKRLAEEATELRASKAADDLKAYADKAAAIRETKPVEGFLRMLTEDPGRVPATKVFFRGDHEQPKDDVLPADLSILASAGAPIELPAKLEELPTTGRRLAYAKHLTSGQHPLFARVIVNRIWLQHFGRGLVASPADFGVLGELPTHPELLDWLATEFVRSGWSVKHMHRLIMASTVYRQTSVVDEAIVNADPLNRLLMRFPLRRLESEIVRDAMLAVSGKLNPKLAGEPVPVMEDAVGQIILGIEKLDGERKPTNAIPLDGEEFRRSVYVQVRRSRTLSVLEAFDAPDMSPNCEKRTASTVALQSLMLMNGQFAVDSAAQLADRLLAEAGTDRNAQLTLGWKLAFGRDITPDDLNASAEFLTQQEQELADRMQKDSPAAVQRQALATWCQALFSSSRFLYYD